MVIIYAYSTKYFSRLPANHGEETDDKRRILQQDYIKMIIDEMCDEH